ncbi:MAG: ATP-binding protein [Candidatus Krumholzibacteria bacterium]|nr:ATP-binding protein [Candidatus Krumholzibacteria bacterium]
MASGVPRLRARKKYSKKTIDTLLKGLDYSTDGIFLSVWDGKILYHNKAWLDIHALDENTDLRGQMIKDIEREDLWPILDKAREETAKHGRFSYQFGTIRRDGKYHDVFFSADVIPGTDPPIVFVILREVTDLVRMQTEIARRNLELELLNEIHGAMTKTWSRKRIMRHIVKLLAGFIGAQSWGIYFIDRSKEQTIMIESAGIPANVLKGLKRIPLKNDMAFASIARSRRTFVIEEELPGYYGDDKDIRRLMGFKRTIGFVFRTGARRDFLVIFGLDAARTIDPDVCKFFDAAAKQFGMAIERVELLGVLKKREKELHDLTVRLIDFSEEERRQCSRMLHDEVGQALTGLKLELEMLEKELGPLYSCTRKSLDAIRGHLRLVSEGTRALSKSLHPAMLDELGLVSTLGWYIDNFVRSEKLDVELTAAGFDENLPGQISLVLYRVAQEALTNVVRHAGASHVAISLTKGYPSVIMEIEDNGRGFSLKQGKTRSKGFGLVSMRERVELMGGTFQIKSSRGKGTTIRVKVPIEAHDDR